MVVGFYIMNESDKHVDNHSLTFKMSDLVLLLVLMVVSTNRLMILIHGSLWQTY